MVLANAVAKVEMRTNALQCDFQDGLSVNKVKLPPVKLWIFPCGATLLST